MKLTAPRLGLAMLLVVLCVVDMSAAQDRRGPFTQPPRSVRSRDFDQQHLRLELAFDWDKRQVRGRAVHTLEPYKPLRSITFDAAEMKIHSVASLSGKAPKEQNRRVLKYQTKANKLSIALDRQYDVGESLTIEIEYLVDKPSHGAHFVVPDKSEPDQPKMVWTQNEPEYAQYWFPCTDSPTDRMTSEIIATVPKEFFVLSNGSLESKKDNGDGTQTWHWSQKKTHVAYLISVVAGDFEAYEQEWNGIPIVSYVPRGRLADAARSFEKTPAMMQYFSQKIGFLYPWVKYTQICVDEYNWGGMEHTSATTLNMHTLHDERAHLDTSSINLVAHELAHQWWGDLLTCKDWGEIWLNESFATYFATLWTEHDEGWDEAAWQRYGEAQSYMGEDKRYRRSIVNYGYNRPDNVFDRHAYPKGGRVLHMLRFELGDELFWRAMNRYCTINQFRTVETADLRIAIEDATGQGMNWFFDQWVYHGGHPEFEVDWRWDDAAKMVVLDVKQTQQVDDTTPLFRSDVEIEMTVDGQPVTRRVTLDKAEQTFQFQADERPSRVCFDPRDWILKTLKFEKSKEEWLDQLAYDKHVIARVRAAQGLAGFPKDKDVLAALSRAAPDDAFWAVRQEAVKAIGKFNGPAARDALLAAAQNDEKSDVRREAIKALGKFSHDSTRSALRKIVAGDKSYYAAADALRALLKVDRANCAADFLAALDVESHRDMILKAACDGLVALKETQAVGKMKQRLDAKISPQQRVVLVSALARLDGDNPKSAELLHEQLDNERSAVRRAAIDALVKIGGPDSLDALLARRGKEENTRMVAAIDEAVEKIRAASGDVDKLRKELETLRKQNRQLENRLKKLESGK